ncbi:MAG: hypothetical protein PHI34_11025 [Acidobacteriota bacterium]|nr:hypothetical protein [Acidobacteriota bacterium]
MMFSSRKILYLVLAILLFRPVFSLAQAPPVPAPPGQADLDALKRTAPRVFLDCDYCDLDYIKTEITFVNYVRDRKEAQIHILFTYLSTGGGGLEYTMAFSGQQEFQGQDDVQKYVADRTQTEEETRAGIVRVLKMGLIRYVAKTPIGGKIGIVFQPGVKPTSVSDKWNFWVFNLRLRTSSSGEQSTHSKYLYGSLSANRTTPEWKIRTSLYVSKNSSGYTYEGTTIDSSSDSKSFSGMLAKSLGEHWSAGAYISAYTSTYSNIKLSLTAAPALEYDLFPYAQSTRRQLTFLYRLNYKPTSYLEETIYDERSESLWTESLTISLGLKEKWGSISMELEGAHYFHDFSKNHVTVYGSLSLRLWKGLSFDVYGSYSMIHDQLSLPKGGATLEEVLLSRKMLETDYSLYLSIGLSYAFGSIYSNVVNPRFGEGGSSYYSY